MSIDVVPLAAEMSESINFSTFSSLSFALMAA